MVGEVEAGVVKADDDEVVVAVESEAEDGRGKKLCRPG